MAQQTFTLNNPILAAAWNGDCSRLAISPNTHEVLIYAPPSTATGAWNLEATLKEHHQPVSSLDWTPRSNKLVSCSHDRNAFVWTKAASSSSSPQRPRNTSPANQTLPRAGFLNPATPSTSSSGGGAKGSNAPTSCSGWQPELVITRLTKAALCVRWSPHEGKLAIGSAAKAVCIGYYDTAAKWWACKIIKRRHESSIVSVAWHPGSVYLATGCTDGRCRVFNAHVPAVDGASSAPATSSFGDCLLEVASPDSAWVHSIIWAPSTLPNIPSQQSSSHGSHNGSGGGNGSPFPGHPGLRPSSARAASPDPSTTMSANAAGSTTASSEGLSSSALLYCSHGSVLGWVCGIAEMLQEGQPCSPQVHGCISHAGLPMKALLALDSRLVVGAGWDGQLRAFACGGGSKGSSRGDTDAAATAWSELALPAPAAGALRSSKGSGGGGSGGGADQQGSLQQRIAALRLASSGSASAALQGQEAPISQGSTSTPSIHSSNQQQQQPAGPPTPHSALVTNLLPLRVPGKGLAGPMPLPGGLVSLGLDGCMVRWDLSSIMPR